MQRKSKEKKDDLSKIINEVSLEVSAWPEWLKKNAEAILASKSENQDHSSKRDEKALHLQDVSL